MISTRTTKLAATAAFAALLGLTTAACGSEQEAPADKSAAPAGSSAPVIAVPPQSATGSVSEDPKVADEKSCGSTSGPDGALQIRVVSGDVDCDAAKEAAKEYVAAPDGFFTSQEKDVSGWLCAPSAEVEGELTRCTKDDKIFSLGR
ncbi:MAG: hypothetical protein QM774_10265 [Gordonia sp. (in: high G+C Gram-positive bacteria)]|uniref:hypothetical protein n=1 Tax=Gordonia sp. (in: high G+C Gram-positive bacteria) TaxID=84139 RepID=UPI0039E43B56